MAVGVFDEMNLANTRKHKSIITLKDLTELDWDPTTQKPLFTKGLHVQKTCTHDSTRKKADLLIVGYLRLRRCVFHSIVSFSVCFPHKTQGIVIAYPVHSCLYSIISCFVQKYIYI